MFDLKSKLLFFLILCLWNTFVFAEKEAPIEAWKTFVINIYFDGKTVKVDKENFPEPIMPTIIPYEKVRPQPGNYKVILIDNKGNILFETTFQPNIGSGIIYLPYFLNLKEVRFVAPNNETASYPLDEIRVCNENNVCEEGEEYLCPLDCKNANNPYYPLTEPIGINIEKTQRETVKPISTPTPPEKVFSNILLFTVIVLGIILVFVIIIFILRR